MTERAADPERPTEWLSEREVCEQLGISRYTARRHLRDYAVLIGTRTWRYDLGAIVAALGPPPDTEGNGTR